MTGSVFDTKGGQNYLKNLLLMHPSPETCELVRRALNDDGSRYTLEEVAEMYGIDLDES